MSIPIDLLRAPMIFVVGRSYPRQKVGQALEQRGDFLLTSILTWSVNAPLAYHAVMTTGNADVVRKMFDTYLKQDRDNAERLIASDFVFSSPQDDFIDRGAPWVVPEG